MEIWNNLIFFIIKHQLKKCNFNLIYDACNSFSNQEDRSIYFECDRRILQLFNCRIGNVTSTKDDRLMIRTSRQKSNHRILMFKIMFFFYYCLRFQKVIEYQSMELEILRSDNVFEHELILFINKNMNYIILMQFLFIFFQIVMSQASQDFDDLIIIMYVTDNG